MGEVKVDYAERELAPNGGNLPEDFAAYLETICNARSADGFRLVTVLPGPMGDGHLGGAWLFFWRQEEDLFPGERTDLGITTIGLEPPLPPMPPPNVGAND
jgi:hypothetical protein